MSDELPQGIDRVGDKFRARAGAGRARVSKVFATLDEAITFRTIANQERGRGAMVFADGMTVEEWGRTWLPRRRARASYSNDRQRWATHVVPFFGKLPLVGVTRRDVKAWLRKLEATLAVRTARNCRSLLSVALREAVDDELLDSNPCDGVKVDGSLPPISDDWYLFPDEQAALLEACGDDPERSIVSLALGAGIRRAELFSLHVRDVHLEEAAPYLMIRFGGFSKGGKLKTPKNGKPRRVALFGIALEAARYWLEALPVYAPTNPHGLLFPCPSGARRVYSRDTPAIWSKARTAVTRIDPWWHLLRHTCASSLVAGWWGPAWSLEAVSAFLGHSSIAVTQRYAHLCPSVLDEKASTMPVVKVVKVIGGNAAKLITIPLSRPGDLNPRPDPTNLEKTGDRDHSLTTAALEVLRAYASADPITLSHAVSRLADALPAARTVSALTA